MSSTFNTATQTQSKDGNATMRAVVLSSPYTISLVSKPIPGPPSAGQVICRVRTSGLCGSDLHTYRGHEKTLKEDQYGFTTGHEFVGEITQLGDGVTSFSVGDRVICPFTTSCSTCWYCTRGWTGRCLHPEASLLGCPKLEGVQAEYAMVPLAETTLVKAPEGVPDTHLILMADIFPTGCFVVRNGWNLLSEQERQGDTVALVIGCGPVGLCAIMAAKDRFTKVFAMDPVAERREMAERYGAIALDPEADPASKMSSLTDGRGPDCVLEVVGHPSALEAATKLVRIGGVVSSCGVHNEELVLPGPLAYGKGLRMQFGRCHARAMLPEALKLLEKISKATPHLVDEFVQKKVRLEEAPEYYKLFDERKIGKVVFDLTQ